MGRSRQMLVDQARLAALLGHELQLYDREPGRKGRQRARCTCGWETSDRRSQAIALGAGFHHIGQVVGEHSRNGVSVADLVDTPDQSEVPAAVRRVG